MNIDYIEQISWLRQRKRAKQGLHVREQGVHVRERGVRVREWGVLVRHMS